MLNMRAKKKRLKDRGAFFIGREFSSGSLIVRICERRFAGFDIYAATVLVEPHNAIYQRENGVVPSKTHVSSREILGSSLSDNDVPGHYLLTAEFLYPEAFADAIAPVFNAALTFFVRHSSKLHSKTVKRSTVS
jgi:hypothetical protein